MVGEGLGKGTLPSWGVMLGALAPPPPCEPPSPRRSASGDGGPLASSTGSASVELDGL